MNREMHYRGPDGSGIWNDKFTVLGHSRLSIIGVENGTQPILNSDGTSVLICNGEIFNHLELRTGLESKGYKFSTLSDSEVILHLYCEYGVDCLKYLRGMFSFCLWDSAKHRLFAARDRCGEKPLYYHASESGIVLSSEIKAIRKHYLRQASVDKEILRQVFVYSYPLDITHTQYQEINRIKPGEYILASSDSLIKKTYWEKLNTPTYNGSYDESKKQLLDIMEQSVSIRMQSEVPVAILLSGGVDSSAVAALATRSYNEVHAITVGYTGNPHCDERASAGKLAEELGLIWHPIEIKDAEYRRYFDEYVSIIDEPVADRSAAAQWAIYSEARKLGYKVLLTGNGGDELFFGYPLHNDEARFLEILDILKPNLFGSLERNKSHQGKRKLDSKDARIFFSNLLQRAVESLFNLIAKHHYDIPGSGGRLTPYSCYDKGTSTFIESVYDFLFKVWLPNDCYILADKLGMGNSIEVRSPFADHKLVEFVSALPLSYRYVPGKPKHLMKEVMRDILPAFILEGNKKGFTPPKDYSLSIGAHYRRYNISLGKRDFFNAVIEKVLAADLKL